MLESRPGFAGCSDLGEFKLDQSPSFAKCADNSDYG